MASLFPTILQVGQAPGSDPVELDLDKSIRARHVQRFRDRDEHILSGLGVPSGQAPPFDLTVTSLTTTGDLVVGGAIAFPEKALIFSNQ